MDTDITDSYKYKYIHGYPVLACNYFSTFFVRPDLKYGFGHETDRQGRYRRNKPLRIRRLSDPNPMENFPDQDSANKLANTSSNFVLLTRAVLGDEMTNVFVESDRVRRWAGR